MAQPHRPRKQLVERLESRRLLAAAVAGVGNGLVANYYNGTNLANLVLTRVDPTVDFQWGGGSPDPAVPIDNFSARWTGKVQAQYTETYTFYTNSDEGVALWVNGQQIIDNFTDHDLAEDSGTISLKAGEMYDIRLQYYETAFDATMQLSWSSSSTAKQIVPQAQLYGDAGWTNGAFLNADIGSPSTAGSVSSIGKTYTLAGGGNGTAGTSDQFQYFYQTMEGDGTIVAQVASTQGSSGGAEAGVMIRSSLDANAPFAEMDIDAAGNQQFEWRRVKGIGATSDNASGAGGLQWLKLVRDGQFIRGYASASGADDTWTYFGSSNIPMGRTVYVGLTATGGTGLALNRAQFKNVKIVAIPPLGAGLEMVRDYSFGNVFVDIAKQARLYQAPNLGPSIPLDSNGYPMADFWTVFLTGYANTAHLFNGTYKLSFTGQADMNTWQTPGGQILNKAYNTATNTTTADIVVNASESADGWYFGMNFLNTRRDANSSLNSGITNLKIIRPGYDPNTTQTFTNLYLQHLKQFSVLRFMDWESTNNNPVVNWSDRTTLNSARQSSTSGVAWEYVVQLANQLHKDIWINVPVKASNDYVTQLATLLKNSLDPDRIVYIEYSNEVWNGIFSQYGDNLNAAIAEVKAGGSTLNSDGETNQIYWAWRRVAKRLKEISDIFGGVWGASAVNSRVRPVLAGQFSNPQTVQQGLEFIERTYGSPSQYFYGVASAPYIGFSGLDSSNPNLTVDDILNALQTSVNSKNYNGFDTYARRYGLANIAYEGGPDTSGTNNLAAKYAASLDPRMQSIVTSYLNGWYNQGASLFNWYYTGPSSWGVNGSWGLTNYLDNLTAPKILGTRQIASTPRQPLTYGTAVPATFDARAVAGASFPYQNTYLKNPGKGKTFDYFLRVPKTGAYQIVFNAATSDSVEQLRIAVNQSDLRAMTLLNTGSLTNFADNIVGNFQLQEGMNLLHVTSISEAAGWNIQTVTVAPPARGGAAPVIVNPANAAATTVTGKTTTLGILGDDDGGEASLLYSWEALNDQPNSVTFSPNGTNAAKNATVTFSRPGTYTLRCTVSDGVATTTSSVNVTVVQTITSVTVAPSGDAVANGETKQLTATAKDQFAIQLYSQPTFSWSVDNGFGTVSSTGLYYSPASGLGTATVRATVGNVSGTASVVTQSPRPADNPAYALAGIEYGYYEGTWTVVPDFSTLTPASTGLLNNISLSPARASSNYGIQYTGYVNVPASATYTFSTSSDDGSKLYIGGQLVVNNDGKHSIQEKSGQIILDAGWHQLKLAYFQSGGGASLTWSYAGGGISKQLIPDAALERADRAPTVATPPSASPNPVNGTSSNLSVVGADESGESTLTYTWSAIALPSSAPQPLFAANGTNAAKNTAVTFYQAGNYVLQVGISDGTLTTNVTLNVFVDATLTSIQISPANPTVKQLHTQQFTAMGYDQFGNPLSSPPTWNWFTDINGGSIGTDGLYTAPDAIGTFSVYAWADGVVTSTTVNVINDPAPTIVSAPSASPNPVSSGSQTTLSALGNDDSGEAELTYTWTATSTPDAAAQPSFSANGTNAAKQTIAGGLVAGNYVFQVSVTDGYHATTANVGVTVNGSAINTAPTIASPATASPAPVTGTTTNLSVLGADDGGEANLTYAWATTGTPPAAVTFSANGTNAAKNVTATFTKPGTYNFSVTIFDGALATTTNTTVTVNQTLARILLSPTSAFLVNNGSKQFTASALDQFGAAMVIQPTFTWSLSSTGGGGTITTSGLYTAPATGTANDTVRASANGIAGSATVTVASAFPADVFGNDADIGSPTPAGSYSFDGSTYTVSGGGADIFNNSDQFHFVYRALSGDGQIMARVASVQNTNSRAKAGVMFRETLAANSRFIDALISPDNTASLQYRSSTGAAAVASANIAGSAAPYWVKLTRSGNAFTAYRSADGASWTQLGATQTITMAANLYVGLCVTSHNTAALNTSTFDHASVSTTLSGAAISNTSTAIATPRTSGATTSTSVITDDNLTTYYHSPTPSGAWVGLDLGSAKTITQVRFVPRKGYESKMIGGRIQVSNSADFSDATTLLVIRKSPKSGAWTSQAVNATKAFRYVRYLAPKGSFGDVAELSFLGF